MSECVFCKIVAGEGEASVVHRGGSVMAFLDINPINQGHVLVVPHIHYERFSNVDVPVLGEMMHVAQRVLQAIETSKIACDGANIFLSDGEVAGQEVPHTHLHIAPRFKEDGHRMGFSGIHLGGASRESLNGTAKLIADAMKR